MNQVKLVDLNTTAPQLRTSYDSRGKTGDTNTVNRQIPWSSCVPVGQARRKWKATPGMAFALAQLDDDVRKHGGEGVRLTETDRDVQTIIDGRTRYAAWIAAGSPDPTKADGKFNPKTMKTAYMAPPNGTNHQWGGATDFNVFALSFPGVPAGDATLELFWQLAEARGFTPIITQPRIMQSEAWHFDHLGPLHDVRELFIAHRGDGAAYRNHANLTAAVGCIVTGTYSGAKGDEEYVRLAQALMLLDGTWCGLPDGDLGPMTIAALQHYGILATRKSAGADILGQLTTMNVAAPQLAAL